MHAAVLQDDVGAGGQAPHGPGHQDLARLGRRHHPGRDVHGQATDVVPT
jgi:hypothetical protein